ncbi:MAG TPA: class I mannose-6-phosphate isomerase [Candidatus Dormibacteraeota bacterium]|nr:class I mannose-6-phosphate isomerase [Candidatus Dormibacteraeota bacterium]
MRPLRLSVNTFHRFYRGGAGIAEFRGIAFSDPYTPEDWVGSTTSTFGCDGPGLSQLEDGRWLRDAIRAEPEAFLGPAHVARFGADPGLLVKLLDPDQRLPVHCHPDRAFSKRHLGLRYGKTEAWIVIATRSPDPTVYLGFRSAIGREQLEAWVDRQETGQLLGAVNPVGVKAGDTVFVPAGLPHAVGPGILIVELQEPTDLSVLMEWKGLEIDGRQDGHLGLGFDTALNSVDRSGWSPDRLGGLINAGSAASLLPSAAESFFRADRIAAGSVLPAEFSILVAIAGGGTIRTDDGTLELRRGETALLPYAAGEASIEGELHAIRCRPPIAPA